MEVLENPAPALAETSAAQEQAAKPRYFRPVNPSAPESSTTSTGTRRGGCFDSEQTPLILAPTGFVGTTANSRPTLTWFLPEDEPVPVEFSVYSLPLEDADVLQHVATVPYSAGFNQYQLPVTLEEDTRYVWQLVLYCNPNRPSTALLYQAEIDFIPAAAASAPQGAAIEQAKEWAAAGYWYDAIAALGTSQQTDVVELRQALLEDLTLLEITTDETTENTLVIDNP